VDAEGLNGLFLNGGLLDVDFLTVAGLESSTILALSNVDWIVKVVVMVVIVNVDTDVGVR
jgi:hypothetical protein